MAMTGAHQSGLPHQPCDPLAAMPLVLDALEMAVGQRRPKHVIHHSDQGSQLGFKRSSQQQA